MKLFLAACVSAFLSTTAMASEPAPIGARLVLEITDADPERMMRAVNIAANLSRFQAARGRRVLIRVVAHGPGLAMLREDVSPVAQRLRFLANSMVDVSYAACSFTASRVEKTEGAPPPILGFAEQVRAGPMEVKRLEKEGWRVIRP